METKGDLSFLFDHELSAKIVEEGVRRAIEDRVERGLPLSGIIDGKLVTISAEEYKALRASKKKRAS